MMDGHCWKCGNCNWVTCYTRAEINEYGEPSECGACYSESMSEIELVQGYGELADTALLDVRKAERELRAATANHQKLEALVAALSQENG